MGEFRPTPDQLRAIQTTGRSLLVSAAAGSGKTEVLARRCVFLMTEAPAPYRCNADELLVLTFTEAAAAQMRERIIGELRRRLSERPDDADLRRQLAWCDLAQISTIHAFCNTLVRRHFSEAGIDPAAVIADAAEATLLRRKVLSDLCEEAYAASRDAARPDHARGAAFVRLVDDYGLGDDKPIVEFVDKVSAFLESLPEPDGWVAAARDRLAAGLGAFAFEMSRRLTLELKAQAAQLRRLAARLAAGHGASAALAGAAREHADQFAAWAARLEAVAGLQSAGDPKDLGACFDAVVREIQAYDFAKPGDARRNHQAPQADARRLNAALDEFDDLRSKFFKVRIQGKYASLTSTELHEGLARIEPYARTLLDIVQAFRESYRHCKRRLGVLDFADLERLAFDLLADCGPSGQRAPSAIARRLQERFHHVLVDEFQDVSPIQAAIVELVSRERSPTLENNFFVVGDVKQSIYRFRLAEPALFMDRHARMAAVPSGGENIPLQANYRSSATILNFVNDLFKSLMTPELSPVIYDDQAMLRHGRPEDAGTRPQAVEVHVLQRRLEGPEDEEEEGADDLTPASTDIEDPGHWSPIEREAYVIGQRIHALRGLSVDGRPLEFRDVAVLLRAAKVNARAIERVLARMGIPAWADAGGGFLEAREVREVLAALRVLDNPQQDIPLASVFRTGMFGAAFDVDDLARIRLHDRQVPFHRAAMAYEENGADAELRDRLHRVRERIRELRGAARRRPLAELLWELYESSGCMALASAMPNGDARRANLLRLHEHARRFATFRQQGLHRFLAFIESLEEEDSQPDAAPAETEGGDAVRILTIHRSKGLEFPVVFVAGLGTRLNFEDGNRRMIYGRRIGLGLRVVDPQRFIEYPSAAHLLVQDELERSTREEELRVLYVALTRAKEKLILVATPQTTRFDAWFDDARKGLLDASTSTLRTARCPLDWIMPVLSQERSGKVVWRSAAEGEVSPADGSGPTASVQAWPAALITSWRLDPVHRDEPGETVRRAVGGLEPLPSSERVDSQDPQAGELLARIDWVYPALAMSAVPAVVPASEFKGMFDTFIDEEQRSRPADHGGDFRFPGALGAGVDSEAARRRGIVTHRALQHLDFSLAMRDGWEVQARRLCECGMLDAGDLALIDAEAMAWFMRTGLAARIAAAQGRFHREFPYIAAEPPSLVDASLASASPQDVVLVRGIVDGVLVEEDRLEIVDYKTDRIDERQLADRTRHYRPQVELYGRAMSRLWNRPVRACHLVFLSPRKVVTLTPGGGTRPASPLSSGLADDPA